MGWLRATYLTVGSFINFLFAIALVASAMHILFLRIK